MEVYKYIHDTFLLPIDKDPEILTAKEKQTKVEYDPNHIPQRYRKAISDVRILLMALKETVLSDEEVERNTYANLERNMDLKEACQE